jgi:hypothetical protein
MLGGISRVSIHLRAISRKLSSCQDRANQKISEVAIFYFFSGKHATFSTCKLAANTCDKVGFGVLNE